MRNTIKSIFFKLSYNTTLRKIAKRIFVYFPNLKHKIIEFRDSSYTPSKVKKTLYTSDFLNTIKKEIENKRKAI